MASRRTPPISPYLTLPEPASRPRAAGRILFITRRHQLLTRAFRHNDHGVTPAGDAIGQLVEKALQQKGHLPATWRGREPCG
jgi:hypothetical protein